MEREKNKRQVRYNSSTDTGDQIRLRNRWIWCTINDSVQNGRIQERIIHKFAPIDDIQELADGKIQGLNYVVFSFSSEKGILLPEDNRKIYDKIKGVRFDRDLKEWHRDMPIEAYYAEGYIPRLLGG